jgi:tetratricopeptide (TPR) repeat protein
MLEKAAMKKLLLILIIILFSPLCIQAAVIQQIGLVDSGERILINLSEYANFRVYQSDRNEIIITFKDAGLHKNAVTYGNGGDFISKVIYEEFPDNISILTIKTKKEVTRVENKFDYSGNNLVVRLFPEKIYYSDKKPLYRQKKQLESKGEEKKSEPEKSPSILAGLKEDEIVEKDIKAEKEPEKAESVFFQRIPAEKEYADKSSLETITEVMEESSCYDSINIKVALRLVNEKDFDGALGRTEAEFSGNVGSECEDKLAFFRLWLQYMLANSGSDNEAMYNLKNKTESFLFTYPESSVLSYGYTLAGLINKYLTNYPLAKGFFHLAEQEDKNYKGMAQVYFNLAEIYYDEEDLRRSEDYLEKLGEKYPETKFNEEAKLLHGQILYSRKRYFDTIRTLGPFMNENSKVIYESPELLKYVADSYFLTGNNEMARELFSRIFNMFPEMEKRDIVLANIGETFENQGNLEKAENIYKLVTQRYPGSEGFVKSSLKLADNMEDRDEKEAVYKMIINDFPDSVEGRISLLRLASIYNEKEEFEESIDLIKTLFKENPRALRKDALHIMSMAMTGYLENILKENNYASALRAVEKNRFFIADMKDYKVHFISGEIYNETHMYEESKERLDMAYKLFPDKKNIPFELLKYKVLTDSELEKYDEAAKTCDEILKKYNENTYQGFAFEKKGDISQKINDLDKSASFYNNAAEAYKENHLKGNVFLKLGELYKLQNKNIKAVEFFDKAVSAYRLSEVEEDKNQLAYAGKNSGEISLKLEDFEKAVSSFETVLDFNAGKENIDEIKFNLGESLRGAGKIKRALEQYKDVFSSNEADELLKKLAEQRIREIELEQTLDRS